MSGCVVLSCWLGLNHDSVCVLAPGLGEGGHILCNVKAASKITAVHNALTLAAATPGKRVLLNVDDLFKLSVYCCIGFMWPGFGSGGGSCKKLLEASPVFERERAHTSRL